MIWFCFGTKDTLGRLKRPSLTCATPSLCSPRGRHLLASRGQSNAWASRTRLATARLRPHRRALAPRHRREAAGPLASSACGSAPSAKCAAPCAQGAGRQGDFHGVALPGHWTFKPNVLFQRPDLKLRHAVPSTKAADAGELLLHSENLSAGACARFARVRHGRRGTGNALAGRSLAGWRGAQWPTRFACGH